jgi:hypothetical protein
MLGIFPESGRVGQEGAKIANIGGGFVFNWLKS